MWKFNSLYVSMLVLGSATKAEVPLMCVISLWVYRCFCNIDLLLTPPDAESYPPQPAELQPAMHSSPPASAAPGNPH